MSLSLSCGFANHVDQNGRYEFEGWVPWGATEEGRREVAAREAAALKRKRETERKARSFKIKGIKDSDADEVTVTRLKVGMVDNPLIGLV